jgi:transposase
LIAQAADQSHPLPEVMRPVLGVLIETLHLLDEKVTVLDAEIARRAEEDEDARRLKTIPGIGPVTAAAISALAPPPQTFVRARDFAAWLGLTPLQRSTGGKQKLGETSKRGERTLRRLLIIGASAVVRWAARKGAPVGSWLKRMLARKPRMLVAVALANKMARIVWALLRKGETYRASIAAA